MSLLTEEGTKARLFVVPVVGQCLRDATVPHHDERSTVNQSPILIRACGLQIHGPVEERCIGRDDDDAGVFTDA